MEKMGGGSEQNDDWLPLLQPESDAESADEMMMTTKTTTLDPLSWFQGLPGEDKSISLSISDKKFIGMILQTVDALSPNDAPINIMKKVKPEDLDRIYSSHERVSRSEMIETSCNNVDDQHLSLQPEDQSANTTSSFPTITIETAIEEEEAIVENANDDDDNSQAMKSAEDNDLSSPNLTDSEADNALRIHKTKNIAITKTEDLSEDNVSEEKEVVTTVLHFESGLTCNIPTKSKSDKKVAAIAAQPKEKKLIQPVSSATASLVESGISNEVHKHCDFTVLKVVSTSNEDKKTKAQRIAESKQSAARAMVMASSSSGRLLKNLRFAFSSARDLVREDASMQPSPLAQDARPQREDGIDDILLTFDPSYLAEQSGMQFLSDVESVIDSELGKLAVSGTAPKCKFLSDEFRIEGGKDATCVSSHWSTPFLQSPKSEVSIVLILLARIEQSILQSYRLQNKNQPQTKVHDKSSLFCLSSNLPKKDTFFLDDVFKSQKRLKEQGLLDMQINAPTPQVASMRIQDLLLIPAQQISLAKSSNDTPTQDDDDLFDRLVSKWNSVIDSAQKLASSTPTDPQRVTDNEVTELFADDKLKNKVSNKNTKKKKKKKKKKKRKLPINSNTASAQSYEQQPSSADVEEPKEQIQEAEPEVEELIEVTKPDPRPDCSESVVSTTSATSQSSKNVGESENNQSLVSTEGATEVVTELNADVTVSKVNGIHGVVSAGRVEEQAQENNDNGWETVETKKCKDKKSSSSAKGTGEKSSQANCQNVSGSSRKNKGKSKNRNRNRQKEKEQAKANLDSLEGNIAKRGANTTKALMEDRNKRQVANSKKKNDNPRPITLSKPVNKSIRDIVMGNLASGTTRFQSGDTLHTGNVSRMASPTHASVSATREKDKVKSPLRRKKALVAADQNTASTVQETVSAASRSFPNVDEASKLATQNINSGAKSVNDAICNAAADIRENSSESSTLDETSRSRTTSTRKSSAPPLQTLYGTGHLNSANSSVASSLDAPHATRYGSHQRSSSKEDDVGYHLLKVCERLSHDMSAFMARREYALSSRRRERGALLTSLQDTVQNIWVGKCNVEMYGSCATQLDLPSSDLDVVICGLDRAEDPKSRTQSFADDVSETSSFSSSVSPASYHGGEALAYANQFYPPLSVNGTRVLRLANELERVPWAVQVKAIPTASVPVIKILADPSRLPGPTGMDWMLHQQHIAIAAVAAAEMKTGKMPVPQQNVQNGESKKNSSSPSSEGLSGTHTSSASRNHHIAAISGLSSNPPASFNCERPPWRGADIMNGLLSLDITFEGPEHGGLGSTAFSANIIQDACNETGLPPESTPVVQVLMIIKELLAQRRLNEPFSGGLSSYAILLLVVAVVKERRIIRKEIERVERQRRAVESSADDEDSPQEPKSVIWPAEKQTKKQISEDEKRQERQNRSSWASVAKKPLSTSTKETSQRDEISKKTNEATAQKSVKSDIPTSSKFVQNSSSDDALKDSTLFPQGSNDVLEVLCSGEPTAGKLLMHFLLFYGRHFDANSACIDVSGKHHPDFEMKQHSKMHASLQLSPFTVRKAGGSYNPGTDVYTVDPLIVYDPLEGAESNNVARSCYAWVNIRWTFEQCYKTLSGVVELGVGSNNNRSRSKTWPQQENVRLPVDTMDVSRQVDEMSPLLELLLSF